MRSGVEWVKQLFHELISGQYYVSYGNQSFDLLWKTNDRFLYETQHLAEMC